MDNQLHPYQDKEERKLFISEPNEMHKAQVENLENIMLRLVGIIPDVDMLYEDIIIKNDNAFYVHTLRSKIINKDKPSFILIHGYQGSSNNYIRLCPYLLQHYNLFIPDTIGMALSSRPQVKFTSTEQCTNFFIEVIEQWRRELNITNFYICGHSLGGYMVGCYVLKYPSEVQKVLLLSPAGISDIRNGGNIHQEAGKGMGCGLSMMKPSWCCKPRFQQAFNLFLCKPLMKLVLRVRYDVSSELNEVMAQLTELAMKYPRDLDDSLFYVFKHPFPCGNNPLEDKLLIESKLSFVICFGEKDWMDQVGSHRLAQKDSERFKVYSVSQFGHMFMLENPKELYEIILKHFK